MSPRHPGGSRGFSAWAVPLVALVVLGVPVLEVWALLTAGDWIGLVPTIGLLLATSALGVWLVRREGLRTWRALGETVARGDLPGRELLDGALVLVGGSLLMLPGFVTDVVGLVCLLPFTRALPRAAITRWAGRAPQGYVPVRRRRGGGPGPTIIPGEIVDEEPTLHDHRDADRPDEPPRALEGRVLD